MTQADAISILKTGQSVFLTGEPGSGKTHTINEYVRYLREHSVEPAITASTGIAATHIGGVTVHSWSGIGIKKFLTKADLDFIGTKERLVKQITKTGVLIIDEISMLDSRLLDLIESIVSYVKRSKLPFGGIQVIFVGDFFQLPPISRAGEPPVRFAFESKAWQRLDPLVLYLSEQHRQEDEEFLGLLTAIRS